MMHTKVKIINILTWHILVESPISRSIDIYTVCFCLQRNFIILSLHYSDWFKVHLEHFITFSMCLMTNL